MSWYIYDWKVLGWKGREQAAERAAEAVEAAFPAHAPLCSRDKRVPWWPRAMERAGEHRGDGARGSRALGCGGLCTRGAAGGVSSGPASFPGCAGMKFPALSRKPRETGTCTSGSGGHARSTAPGFIPAKPPWFGAAGKFAAVEAASFRGARRSGWPSPPPFPPAAAIACGHWKWGEVRALQLLLESDAASAAREGCATETCCAACVLNSLEDEQGFCSLSFLLKHLRCHAVLGFVPVLLFI